MTIRLPQRLPFLLITILMCACTAQSQSLPQASFTSSTNTNSSSLSSRSSASSASYSERLSPESTLLLGNPNAPLRLTIVTHPSCDYCRTFQESLLPRLQNDFVQKGALEVEFLILPIKKYPQSELQRAAVACAANLGKGMAMLNALFQKNPGTRKDVESLGATLTIPADPFHVCLGKTDAGLFVSQAEFLASHQITLVPSFVLQHQGIGQTQVGLPEYADLRGWIESVMH